MIKEKYFIQQFLDQEYFHGGVGGTDAEKILLSKGFTPVLFPHHYHFSIGARVSRFFFLLKTFFRLKGGAVVIFLFPVYARMNRLLLKWLSKRKEVTLVCFVADINGLKDGDERVLREEIQFFRQFKHFIVHNDRMRQWVLQNIAEDAITANIEFFDFLAKPVDSLRTLSPVIDFAGNLDKSKFLEKLESLAVNHSVLSFNLYGPGATEAMQSQGNASYHGVEKPYDLPSKLKGSFGLLWDGNDIDKPGGSLGEYMKYISHHKLSLYIISKLPIIVPSSAASAPLVEKYKIGFSINNLFEIEGKIGSISSIEYMQMCTNMEPLAEKISKGQCLGNAIDEIMRMA